MDTSKSLVRTSPKPINVFYVWYTELCRRLNCTPAPAVKPAKPKCQTVLEFVGDRLRVEEWNPIINALRHDTSLHVINIRSRIGNCQFLHDADTEEKAKHTKRRFGSLWTAYVLRQLLKSLSASLRNTQVLTCLELDGLPMFSEYLEPLLQALKKNKTVKSLSFANCAINDIGCQLVCTYLRFTPNIEVVNLSGCGLSQQSGQHLAKVIKYQQINRYCESWHNSLRYENPESNTMRGVKRITMNCNPNFGDDGFSHILDELEDDLWIKALDLQKCGITDNLSSKIIDVIEYNRSLEIVDLRQNELLDISTIERILQILRDKIQFGQQPEFQWCNTALSLTWNSVNDSTSKFSFTSNVHKTKSAPMKKVSKDGSSTAQDIRKSKTIKKVYELNTKLRAEIEKRKQIEKRNEELEHELEQIKSSTKVEIQNGTKYNLKTVSTRKKPHFNTNDEKYKTKEDKSKSQVLPYMKNGVKNKGQKVIEATNGYKNGVVCSTANGHKNGLSSKVINSAYKIFEHILKRGECVEEKGDNLSNYFSNAAGSSKTYRCDEVNVPSNASASQISLIKYMEELKHGDTNVEPNLNPNAHCTSKYFIKENDKR
ncbi:hypothetical protein NQ318_008832 [Aromia moschata]|uniref:Centrosomal protein of 78 kDa n=1 Tax=Aromia moschata TaxID=1265417 RepID=A0AAV8ZCR1_9CUCU|nr:hypothetical protein NQ318_008832 [Aromia moschata]